MKITYYGHSCFSINLNGKTVLIDPFISPNELAKDVDVDTIHADFILVSHGHEDHVADLVSIAKRTGALVIASFEIHTWLQSQGVTNTHPMNTGGSRMFEFGKVKFVNAIHSSSLPDGTYAGSAAGFVIEADQKVFYYSGDTALHMDMKLLGEHYVLDFAFLCIGDNFTMGYQDAVVASDYIKCNKIIGMHYDTFGYIKMDHAKAIEAFSAKGKTLTLFKIGESFDF